MINGLPVMMNRTNFGRPPDLTLDKYYEENVIGGPGSFMIVADNFDHFGRAVRTKLVRESPASTSRTGQYLPEALERRDIARELHGHAEMAERIAEDVGRRQAPCQATARPSSYGTQRSVSPSTETMFDGAIAGSAAGSISFDSRATPRATSRRAPARGRGRA